MNVRDQRRGHRHGLPGWALPALVIVGLVGCTGESASPPVRDSKRGDGPGVAVTSTIQRSAEGADPAKYTADQRALRRAYDGAPPVIFHEPLGIECTECHSRDGIAVAGIGFAPPSPHEETSGLSLTSRCEQCHVYTRTDDVWVLGAFSGLRQDLRQGGRLFDGAPPTIPHKTFMRENCKACHTGPAAREEIRTSHPDRPRCRQCHVPVTTTGIFASVHDAPPLSSGDDKL